MKHSISKKQFSLEGFSFTGINIGIKNQELDFGVIYSRVPANAYAVFTKNRCPGSPIIVGKQHIRNKMLQAIVVNSKNANAYTGAQGIKDAYKMCEWAKDALMLSDKRLVLPSSTGIIGVPLDMSVVKKGFKDLKTKLIDRKKGVELFSKAIMTSDAYHKWGAIKIGKATLVGVAKGAGMIEPNMATMLAYFLTDAQIPTNELKVMLREAVNISFNAITVDSDTSTSDTAVIMANGLSGKINNKQFGNALNQLAIYLAQQIMTDGEGANKVMELRITRASNERLATVIAKSVLNSPLVKTAIYGSDLNLGRIIMAIGKVDYRYSFDPKKIKLYAYLNGLDDTKRDKVNKILLNDFNSFKTKSNFILTKLKKAFHQKKVVIEIEIGNGKFTKTFWGSDLGIEYVKYNSEYAS